MTRKIMITLKKDALALKEGVFLTAKLILFPFIFVISLIILQFILLRKHE